MGLDTAAGTAYRPDCPECGKSKNNPVDWYQVRLNSTGPQHQQEKGGIMFMMVDRVATDPYFRKWVVETLAKPNGFPRNPKDQIQRINDWLEKNIIYSAEPGEILQDPRTTVWARIADCDDFATLAAAMGKAIGLKDKFIFIKTPLIETPNGGSVDNGWHVYPQLGYISEKGVEWQDLDPSMPKEYKGWKIRPKALHTEIVTRQSTANFAYPGALVAKLTSSPNDIYELKGGNLASAGITTIRAGDLDLLIPDSTTGRNLDRLKATGKRIRAGIQKVGKLAGKIANSPLVKLALNALPPPANMIASKVAEKVSQVSAAIKDPARRAEVLAEATAKLEEKLPPNMRGMASQLIEAGKKVANKALSVESQTEQPLSLKQQWIKGGTQAIQAAHKATTDKVQPSTLPITQAILPQIEELSQSLPGPLRESIGKAINAVRKVKDSQPAAIISEKLAALTSNSSLLDRMSNLPVPELKAILDIVPPEIQGSLANSIRERMQTVKSNAAQVANNVFSKMLDGPSALLGTAVKAWEQAADADRLLTVNEAHLDAIRDKLKANTNQPNFEPYSIQTLRLRDMQTKALEAKNRLVNTVAQKVGQKLPNLRNGASPLQAFGPHLTEFASALLGLGKDSNELELFKSQIADLHGLASNINAEVNKLRDQVR